MEIKVEKILVPVDTSSTSGIALKAAIAISECYKAQLLAHHVIENPTLAHEVKSKIDSIASGHNIQYSESKGSVYKELITQADKEKANLIVMGTHGISGFQEFWMGSNAYKVVSSAKCPVITIRERADHLTFKNIVLPVDTSFETRQKVPFAVDLARHFGSTIHVLGVSVGKDKEAEHQVNSYARQVIDNLQEKGVAHTFEKRLGGNITNTTINFAKEKNADLIIIMTEQELQIGSLFLGKFAQQMVNHSPIPVASIPPREDILISEARL